MFHTYVASKCFIWMLHMLLVFHLDVALFCNDYTRVSLVFQMYDANVSSRCCKSRYSVVHVVAAGPTSICMGVEGMRAVDARNRTATDRDGSGRRTRSDVGPHMKQVCGACVQTRTLFGRPGASLSLPSSDLPCHVIQTKRLCLRYNR
jgi:hypothetical protein